MIAIEIPGFKVLKLEHLVMDYNGTLACDGELVSGVKERLKRLSKKLSIHIITADTFGKVKKAFEDTDFIVKIMPKEDQAVGKLNYINQLGADKCVCIGNGRNDRLMLEKAALGIAVMLKEGTSKETLMAADVFIQDILDALDLLENPLRLVATLRS